MQRNEDIVLAEMINKNGGKYGFVEETYIHHQTMMKHGSFSEAKQALQRETEIVPIGFARKENRQWEIEVHTTQAKGIIKYLDPLPYLIIEVKRSLYPLLELKGIDWAKFRGWVGETNPKWLPYIRYVLVKQRFRSFLKTMKTKFSWIYD